MFRVTHTTPKRVLNHLRRLQREGTALLAEPEVSQLDEGRWTDRVFRYLSKISEDPETFERVIARDFPHFSSFPPPAVESVEEMSMMLKRYVENHLITLAGAIEQFEAQYEE
jgi:hypothetical protein